MELAQKSPLSEDYREEFSFPLEGPYSPSQLPAEELEPLKPAQLAERLMHRQERRGDLIYAWRRLVERWPDQGAQVLRLLAEKDEWPSDAWHVGLLSLQKAAESQAQDAGLYELLALAPDRLFSEENWAIASWLYAKATSLPTERAPLFRTIFERCWRAATEHGSGIQDSFEAAINHPAGILTQALIEWLAARKPQGDSELPADLAPSFERVVSGEGGPYTTARVVLASQLLFLYNIAPGWTQSSLLRRLDWNHSAEAGILWKSYLESPRLAPDLLKAFGPHLIASIRHRHELGREARNLERLLTLVSLEIPGGLPMGAIQELLRTTDEEGLIGVAEILADMLEGSGEQRAVLWHERIGPWLRQCWPRRKDQQTPGIAVTLALTTIKAGPAFPEAVDVVSGSLKSSTDISGVLFALTDSSHPDQHPQSALTLLDRILPFDRPEKAFGLKSYLAGIRDRIARARPEVVDRPEYRRLCDFLLRVVS